MESTGWYVDINRVSLPYFLSEAVQLCLAKLTIQEAVDLPFSGGNYKHVHREDFLSLEQSYLLAGIIDTLSPTIAWTSSL